MPPVNAQLEENIRLSKEKDDLIRLVRESGSVSLNEFSGRVDDLRELISSGYLRLKIATYVWGVEYFVTLAAHKN